MYKRFFPVFLALTLTLSLLALAPAGAYAQDHFSGNSSGSDSIDTLPLLTAVEEGDEDGYQQDDGDGSFSPSGTQDDGDGSFSPSGTKGTVPIVLHEGGDELDTFEAPVCRIGATWYPTLDGALEAVNATPSGAATTISLLADITYNKCLRVEGRTVVFDLNGRHLDIVANSDWGLYACANGINPGEVRLADPYSGELNVTGYEYGVYASTNCRVEVTNATATAGTGVYTNSAGCLVTVHGDVRASGGNGVRAASGIINVGGSMFVSGGTGAYAVSGTINIDGSLTVSTANTGAAATGGGKITIGGALSTAGGNYVSVGGGYMTKEDGAIPANSYKPGCYAYTDAPNKIFQNNAGYNTIWVADILMRYECEIVGMGRYDTFASALLAVDDNQTIRLLDNAYINDTAIIDNKKITLDLNGKSFRLQNSVNINVYGPLSYLTVVYNGGGFVFCGNNMIAASNGGEVSLPSVGGDVCLAAVNTGSALTVYGDVSSVSTLGAASIANNGTITVKGSIAYSAPPSAPGVFAASMSTGGLLTVGGNLSSNQNGVKADSSFATIYGTLSVGSGKTYIMVDGVKKAKGDYTKPSPWYGYLEYAGASSTIYVKDPNVPLVCEIVETAEKYASIQAAIESIASGSSRTIRLLSNSTYNGEVTVSNNIIITLDLNGKKLNVNSSEFGLYVLNGGSLTLLDPYNGEFNICSTGIGCAGISVAGSGVAEATSVRRTGIDGSGIHADTMPGSSRVTVYGDVTIAGSASIDGVSARFNSTIDIKGSIVSTKPGGRGVFVYGDATNGGKVTVGGKISGFATPVEISGIAGPPPESPTSAKLGYIQYTNKPATPNAPSAYTVWVKDPDFDPMFEIVGGLQYDDLRQAIDAIPAGGDGTIRVLRDYTYRYYLPDPLTIDGKIVKIDLNGKVLDVVNTYPISLPTQGVGILVRNSGSLRLLNPADGELNVTGTSAGVRAELGGGAEVTRSVATGAPATGAIGAFAAGAGSTVFVADDVKAPGGGVGVRTEMNGAVYVYGDVLVSGNAGAVADTGGTIVVVGNVAGYTGPHAVAEANSGGKIMIIGGVIAARDGDYVLLGGLQHLSKTDYSPLGSLRQGLLAYTDAPTVSDQDSFAYNTVWIWDEDNICSVYDGMNTTAYKDFGDAVYDLAALPGGSCATITLYGDIDFEGGMVVEDKDYTFDLNGHTLNIHPASVHYDDGLVVDYAGGAGHVRLLDPLDGQLNVMGRYALSVGPGCSAEVTNATSYASSGMGAAVWVDGGDATVYGDATVMFKGTNNAGVAATTNSGSSYGGKATINGGIYVPLGASYVTLDGVRVIQPQPAATSSKQGYLAYTDAAAPTAQFEPASNTVWVRRPEALPVCTVASDGRTTPYYDFARAADFLENKLETGRSAVVKLLQNTEYSVSSPCALEIHDNTVTLDLNGFSLNMLNTIGDGLIVYNKGQVRLLNPYNGEFNVTTYGDGIIVADASWAEATNVKTLDYGALSYSSVYVQDMGSEAVIYGNVSSANIGSCLSAYSGGKITARGDVTKTHATGDGVYVGNTGAIVIDGALTVPPTSTYIDVSGETRLPGDYTMFSSMPGYREYSNSSPGSTGRVWVRDPALFAPVTDIAGAPAGLTAGVPLTLAGQVVPHSATNKTIVWSVANAGSTGAAISGRTLTATSAGTVVLRATVANGRTTGTAFTKDFYVAVADPPSNLITLSATHAMLADTVSGAKFTATLAPGHDMEENYQKIEWALTRSDGSPTDAAVVSISRYWYFGAGSVTVYATAPLTNKAQTLVLTATYDKKYTATATIEILPNLNGVCAKLLETKATVNTAKEVGALVPILITCQDPDDFGMRAFSGGRAEPSSLGTWVVDGIDLVDKNDNPIPGYSARLYGYDDRYIRIDAAPGAAKQSGVRAKLYLTNSRVVYANGYLALSAASKLPPVTIKAGTLNLAWPGKSAPLTATSPAGECAIVSAALAKAADTSKVRYAGESFFLGAAAKKGAVAANVTVRVDGYTSPVTKKVSIKIVDSPPRVKLSQTKVSLVSSSPINPAARIQLLSADKKVPFESGYKVAGVELSGTDAKGKAVKKPDLDVSYSGGIISIAPSQECAKGTAWLKVTFAETTRAVWLKLNLSIAKEAKVKPLSKVKAATVSTSYTAGAKIADIPMTYSASNFSVNTWKLVSVNGLTSGGAYAKIDDAIKLTPGANTVALTVKDTLKLKALVGTGAKKAYTLAIGSDSLKDGPKYNTLKFTLTVVDKAPKLTAIPLKGAVDIASPGSAITATAAVANASADIEWVRLLNAQGTGALAGQPNTALKVTAVSGRTFKIVAAHGQVPPGAPQKLSCEIKLKGVDTPMQKTITVTPKQTVPKAKLSKASVTLNRWTPQTGDTISVSLTAPKNAQPGIVSLNQASLDALGLKKDGAPYIQSDGFKLVRQSESAYTICFADDKAPAPAGAGKRAADLKKSYTIKLEVWAAGTYRLTPDGAPMLDINGRPIPLTDKDAAGKPVKSKPTLVPLKVNIK